MRAWFVIHGPTRAGILPQFMAQPGQAYYHTHPLCNSGPHTPPLTCVCDPHLLCHSTLLLQLTCITDLLPHSTTTSLSKRSGFPTHPHLKIIYQITYALSIIYYMVTLIYHTHTYCKGVIQP